MQRIHISLSGGVSEETWKDMSAKEKAEYIKEHPNSKYAKGSAKEKKEIVSREVQPELTDTKYAPENIQNYRDVLRLLHIMERKYNKRFPNAVDFLAILREKPSVFTINKAYPKYERVVQEFKDVIKKNLKLFTLVQFNGTDEIVGRKTVITYTETEEEITYKIDKFRSGGAPKAAPAPAPVAKEEPKQDRRKLSDKETFDLWKKELATEDYQKRDAAGRAPRPGIADTLQVDQNSDGTVFVTASFKNTDEKSGKQWLQNHLKQKGLPFDADSINSAQTGDYQDDWIEVSVRHRPVK